MNDIRSAFNDIEIALTSATEAVASLRHDAAKKLAHLRAILHVCPGCLHFDPENPETGCITQASLTHPCCARRAERARRVACG